jgi:cation transport ATPase
MALVKNESTRQREEHAILALPLSTPVGTAERELRTLKGVNDVSINYLTHRVQVTYDPTKTTSVKIRSLLKKLGSREPLRNDKSNLKTGDFGVQLNLEGT